MSLGSPSEWIRRGNSVSPAAEEAHNSVPPNVSVGGGGANDPLYSYYWWVGEAE